MPNQSPSLKVLVVDDSTFIRSVLISYLKEAEVNDVQLAGSGDEVLKILQGGYIPDLIFLDLVLPDRDGFEIMKFIQSFVPSSRIVILSGLGEDKIILNALRNGAREFLPKPIKKENVILLIDRIREEISALTPQQSESKTNEIESLQNFLTEIINHSAGDFKPRVVRGLNRYLETMKRKKTIRDFQISDSRYVTLVPNSKVNLFEGARKGELKGLVFSLSEFIGKELAIGLIRDAVQTLSLKQSEEERIFIRVLLKSEGLDAEKWANRAKQVASKFGTSRVKNTFDEKRVLVAAFELTEMGPEIIHAHNQDLLPYDILFKSGMFYFSIMGQGDTYTTGVYGPFPVSGTKDWNAVVYGTLAKNPNFKDPRMLGNTYLMIAIFYPTDLNHFFADRKGIEQIISRIFGNTPKAGSWGENELKRIVKEIAHTKSS